ncbi:MAG: transglutaminase domain-containing protein [Spirochaetes bacterium]|nr:transglutaminase domain-containing protein [Spirochaetota bacterium]
MKYKRKEFQIYLKPTEFINSDSQDVIAYAESVAGTENSDIDKAVKLYYAVRDDISYDPYRIDLSRHGLKASTTLEKKYGFCISKAVLLAATARVMHIPSRLHFADVKNHLTSRRLYEMMQSDIFVYHAYAELYLEDKWVKATPAFNRLLCRVSGVEPLEFDGRNDSIFQQFDLKGNKFMDYINDRGSFADVPYEELFNAFKIYHQKLIDKDLSEIEGVFEKEVDVSIE